MQYVGEKRTLRVKRIGGYDASKGKDRFLLDKGLMMDYLLSDYSKRGLKLCSMKADGLSTVEYDSLSPELKEKSQITEIDKNLVDDFMKIEYEGNEYLQEMYDDGRVYIYKMLPQMYDDETFRWKYNKKYRTYESTVSFGMFEFYCIANVNNDVDIDVRYAKCDNRHRNRVTITTIRVVDGNNKVVLDAIKNWKDEFAKEINGMM